MSQDKTKITLRIDNAVYEHFKDKKNYQANINVILQNYVHAEESKTYGTAIYIFDPELNRLNSEASKELDILRSKLITKVYDKSDYWDAEIRPEVDAKKENNEKVAAEITARYNKLIDAVSLRVSQITPRKYMYQDIYDNEISSHKEECAALMVYSIQHLERYFIGDLFYKDTQFSLKSLDYDDYKIAVTRMKILISFIIETSLEQEVFEYDEFVKIINEDGISKKKILEFVFFPIFEMKENEKEIEDKIKSSIPEYEQVSLYNYGFFDSFEAQILTSYLINLYIKDNVNELILEDNKFKGIDMTIGLNEIRASYNFCWVNTNKNGSTLTFNPEKYDELCSSYDLNYLMLEQLKKAEISN